MKKDQIMFYIEDEQGMQYWWTGDRFVEEEERAMSYNCNKPKEFIVANLEKLPQVKQMLKIPSIKFEDIKVW